MNEDVCKNPNSTICIDELTVPADTEPLAIDANDDVATVTVLPLLLPTQTYPSCNEAVKLPLISKCFIFSFIS